MNLPKHIKFILLSMVLFLAACAGPPPAPVEDRSQASGYQGTPDGYYRVRSGDSLYAISFRFGIDWQEIARLNGIQAPYVIHPDQLLRLGANAGGNSAQGASATSGGGVKTAAVSTPASSTRTVDTPRSSTTSEYDPAADKASSSPVASQTESTASTAPVASPSASRGSKEPAGVSYSSPSGDPDRWIWPTEGRVISNFQANDATRKGIDIGGKSGQAVIASAGGQVVYSGSGLIGYGELIIIKHSDRMLSAYAHNSKRLVTEGQQVTAGSAIAEMGTNDRNQPLLHFEIRVNGVPTDPLKFLPQR